MFDIYWLPHAVLLHNAGATRGSRRFTHPDEKIMCSVHTGTVRSGQGVGGVGWEWGWGSVGAGADPSIEQT